MVWSFLLKEPLMRKKHFWKVVKRPYVEVMERGVYVCAVQATGTTGCPTMGSMPPCWSQRGDEPVYIKRTRQTGVRQKRGNLAEISPTSKDYVLGGEKSKGENFPSPFNRR